MIQYRPEPNARASHARGALLAQPELMTPYHTRRMAAAEIAGNRVVRVPRAGVIERTGLAAAGCRIERRQGFSEVGKHQSAGLLGGSKGVIGRHWPLAQKLAVSAITEIESIVARTRGGEIGSGHHRLCLEGFKGRGWRHLGCYHGSYGNFAVHRDHGNQFVVARFDGQDPVELAFDSTRDTQTEVGAGAVRSRNADWRGNPCKRDGADLAPFQDDPSVAGGH